MKVNYLFEQKGDLELKITTFYGLEEVLAKELQRLGGKNIEPFTRGVSVTGDLGFVYKANLCLHTALKIMIPITSFIAGNEEELYKQAGLIEWERFLNTDQSFMIESVLNTELYNHSLFVSQKIKDAIADRFRRLEGKRPSVDLIRPDLRLYARVFNDEVSLYIDSSGDPLYKRGYRAEQNLAPLKEVLAAGLVSLSGWEPHHVLIDGMCGSGTIAIEAALLANKIPPGYFRQDFGFMRWQNFDEQLYDTILDNALNRISNKEVEIIGNEIDPYTVKKALANVGHAKVEDVVKIQQGDFFDIQPTRKAGTLILNPPYGERLPVHEITGLYKEIGNKLKKDFSGFNAWIITSNPEAIKAIGLRTSRKIKIYNGSLECRYLKYEMYQGSKRDKYLPPKE